MNLNALKAAHEELLSRKRSWFASPTITMATPVINQGDAYTFLAADFTGADTDADFDHYLVTVLPTHGTLKKSGAAAVAGTTTFTEANLTAGLLTYENDGLAGTDDAMTIKAVDVATNQSAATVMTLTITDGSWLLTYVQSGLPPLAVRFSLKTVAQAQEALLEASGNGGGVGTTVFLPAAVVTGLPVNYFHPVASYLAAVPKLSASKSAELDAQAAKLARILGRTENSALSALINTWGAAIELEVAGRSLLTEELAAQYRNAMYEVDGIPATFPAEFPYKWWWEVLTRVQALI